MDRKQAIEVLTTVRRTYDVALANLKRSSTSFGKGAKVIEYTIDMIDAIDALNLAIDMIRAKERGDI